MSDLQLHIHLLSDTTFGRGDGVAGVVDQEIEHDPQTGLPFVKGRTLKGLLVEECANILYSLEAAQSPALQNLTIAAQQMFGQPGSTLDDRGILHIGTATLPEDLQAFVRHQVELNRQDPNSGYTSQQILESLTDIRYQTAVNPLTDVPLDNTLRAMRVLLRGTVLVAPLILRRNLEPPEKALLAACVQSVRRAGQSRNRGRGRIEMTLNGLQDNLIDLFEAMVEGRD